MNSLTQHKRQNGAALVVGLILLMVITILAISGMNTATTELAMARNDQNYENAFQAAETGLERALSRGIFNTLQGTTMDVYDVDANGHDKVTAEILYEDATLVPDKAFSLGTGSGISALHFIATSTASSLRDPGGTTDRDATAIHTQAFYVVGPEASTL
jgi:type IV pilus assembly protein PilX